jgi:phosphoribosylformylglycinamidine synthase
VSLYNEDRGGAAVPPSPIVACVGRLPDLSRHSTPGLKAAGDVLLLVGPSRGALGGSVFAESNGRTADPLPGFDVVAERADLALVVAAHARGLVAAAHDVSEGGVVQALAEMAFAGGAHLGFRAAIAPWVVDADESAHAWFSEEPGFVLAVDPAHVVTLAAWAEALGARLAVLGGVASAANWSFATPGQPETTLDPIPLAAAWSTRLEAALIVADEVLA